MNERNYKKKSKNTAEISCFKGSNNRLRLKNGAKRLDKMPKEQESSRLKRPLLSLNRGNLKKIMLD